MRPRLNEEQTALIPAGPRKLIARGNEDGTYKTTRGDKVIQFCNTLRVPSGKDVGKPVILRDWQCNLVKALYDPVDSVGVRIVREACLTMARKNAKTTLAAFLALAHLVGPEVQRNGELYSAGFRRDQAAIIWRTLYQIIVVDDELSLYCTWSRNMKTIDCGQFGTSYKAISAEAKSKHGFNPSFVVLDELSQFGNNRDLYDVFKTSGGAQDEFLLLTISTQAADDMAIMSEVVDYGEQVRDGDVDDPSFVLFKYSCDEFDDIQDEKTWYKANPALGDFRSIAEMRQLAERARRSPSAEATFRNLYLNMRTSATVNLVSPSVWRANGEPVVAEEMYGRKCWVGIDLSEKTDLTAMVLVFPDEDNKTFDIIPHFWTPADTLEDRSKRDRVPYLDWVELGFLEANPGKAIDYSFVCKKLFKVLEMYDVQGIVYDRWRITMLKAFMVNEEEDYDVEGLNWIEHGQGYKDMSPAIEIVEENLLGSCLRHGNHPVLTFCCACAKVSKDPAGNRKYDKVRSTGKIDGMVAMTMALYGAQHITEGGTKSVYEKRGITVLKGGEPEAVAPAAPRSFYDAYADND